MRSSIIVSVFVSTFLLTVSISPVFSDDFAFIDLKPYANSNIVDTQWWTGTAGSSDLEELVEIASDGHEFEGPGGEMVSFKVEDANLCIYGTNSAQNPISIEDIAVGMQAEAVFFVHMTGWEAMGAPSYKFAMNYEDGSNEELLMESGINSDDWCSVPAALQDENSIWLWQETGVTCGQVGVIATKWENPFPGKRIKTIDFVSLETSAVPGLFAITLTGALAAVSPGGKLVGLWADLKARTEF